MQSLRFQVPRAARAFSTTPARPLAKMQLIGRLADQPELVDTSTGRQLVKYALGVNKGPRDESGNQGVSWFKVASFLDEGPQRDLLLSLPKGTQLYVEAEARMDTYEIEGQKRTSLNLLQRNFEALQRPRQTQEEDINAAHQAAAGQ
ncbi:Single-stranded DNA-binding protein 1 [Pseudocercospora fuligena]|uniref:Single-stranded DNA-binding protein 1 n=1 Tax=Pseudocercospora fuligena TaxID=685502 RepID=A0A8H6RJA3_9PEZI|nr:Single-stranded DNA-binding protein 1 [Pseudocercospora fuligena]